MSQRPSGPAEARAYPRDEFDDITPGEGRRGAHRARPNPVLAMLPLLLVVVLVVAVVVGAITVLDDAPVPATEPPVAVETSGTASPEPTGDATATAPGTAEPTSPPTETGVETGTPEPVVDPDAPLTVLNGTRTSGLATGATELLQDEGWRVLEAGNYREGDPPPTTVFYPSEALAATAEAVAEDLGGAATELSDEFGSEGLTVVLGEDYEP